MRRSALGNEATLLDRYWREWKRNAPGYSMKDSQTLKTQFRVADFVSWQREGALELNPNFQRRPVWKKGAKSYLVDTIIRGLPMPLIFLRDLPTDLQTLKARRDVVDGQQRIRTILSFINQSLLADFDATRDDFEIDSTHNKALGGKRFTELAKEDQQRILDYQFSVHVFPVDTDEREILQIFARMNATGVKLNAQELRNAEFYGAFKTVSYEMATEQLPRWREWRVFTPNQIARMNEVELTSEFMLLIIDGVLEKTAKTITDYYEHYDHTFDDQDEVANRFRGTLDVIDSVFQKDVISDLFGTRTLFFALFASIYGLRYGLRTPANRKWQRVRKAKPKAVPSGMVTQIERAAALIKRRDISERLLKALRGATTHASERRAVIEYLVGRDVKLWQTPS